jgi:hypothetical protein
VKFILLKLKQITAYTLSCDACDVSTHSWEETCVGKVCFHVSRRRETLRTGVSDFGILNIGFLSRDGIELMIYEGGLDALARLSTTTTLKLVGYLGYGNMSYNLIFQLYRYYGDVSWI